ncbi:hypothetical protein ANANG_G00196280 [Anguilla anguilla]|uniref:Chemokine interleukin-8-like domain-containing protein n=1 Tax=Anguilla anguilla TaxID=7936 RepID=A0A9D3M1Y6_ANGAN|nr:hypothetical protein ANANG_G00196280 [Anguilla anguilla]
MRIIILFWICAALVITDMTEAHPMSDSQRCICTGQMRSQIRPKNILMYQVYPETPACDRVEIVVLLNKPRRTVCLDPNYPIGQALIQRANLF